MVDFKRENPTIRELERDRSLTSERNHIFTNISSATETTISLGDRGIPVSMTITNTSGSVVTIVDVRAKSSTGGTDYNIIGNMEIPIGATLVLDANDISVPSVGYNISVNTEVATAGTVGLTVITRF